MAGSGLLQPEHLEATSVEFDSRQALIPAPPHSSDAGDWLAHFDQIYREAAGDTSRIPWAHRQACPALISWLNAEAPSLVRCGARAAVVGCGLGEDALALLQRGYDVTAFDACPEAIRSARALHQNEAETFVQADLLDLPGRLRGRFELVVEVHTLQALPPSCRVDLARGMAELLTHRGQSLLVAVARGRDESIPLYELAGPPFPLTSEELEQTMRSAGLSPMVPIDDWMDDRSPPVRRLRGVFRRG